MYRIVRKSLYLCVHATYKPRALPVAYVWTGAVEPTWTMTGKQKRSEQGDGYRITHICMNCYLVYLHRSLSYTAQYNFILTCYQLRPLYLPGPIPRGTDIKFNFTLVRVLRCLPCCVLNVRLIVHLHNNFFIIYRMFVNDTLHDLTLIGHLQVFLCNCSKLIDITANLHTYFLLLTLPHIGLCLKQLTFLVEWNVLVCSYFDTYVRSLGITILKTCFRR